MELELTTSPLAPFLDLRTAVITTRIGDGGPDTCAVLTEGLDSSLRGLAGGLDADAAIVALGGYGRRVHPSTELSRVCSPAGDTLLENLRSKTTVPT